MEKTQSKKKSFFYGWVIVAACMLIQAVPFSIAANLQPTFTNYVMSAEGFTLAQFSLIFTIGTVVSAVCSPFIGKLYSNPKTNIKLLYTAGVLMLGGGFAAFSLAGDKIFVFYAVSILVQIGSAIISAIGVPTLLNAWFTENKGLAMGLAFAGSGFGNIFLQLLAGKWLPVMPYQQVYIRFGLIAIAVSLPLALFVLRLPRSKEELELNKPKKKESSNTTSSNWGYAFAEVTKMKFFWVFAVSFFFVGLYVGGMVLQFIPYLQTLEAQGVFLLGAATVAASFGLFSMCGNLFGGILFDKLGAIKTLAIGAIAVMASGVALLMAGTSPLFAHVHSILKGLAMFVYMMTPAYMVGAFFGNKEYGSILGLINLNFALGFCIGSALFGVFVGNFGYNATWIGVLVCVALAFTLLITAATGMTKANKERMERLKDKNSAEIA